MAFVPGTAAGGDLTRVHLLRQWYRRCYLDHVDSAMGLQHPLRLVTDAEAAAVAHNVATRTMRRVVDADGYSLYTAQGTMVTDVDRRLLAGDTGVVPANASAFAASRTVTTLRRAVASSWRDLSPQARRAWADRAHLPDLDPGQLLAPAAAAAPERLHRPLPRHPPRRHPARARLRRRGDHPRAACTGRRSGLRPRPRP